MLMELWKLEGALFCLWLDTIKQLAFFSQPTFGDMKSNEFKIHLIKHKELTMHSNLQITSCYSIITDLFAKYEANPRELKEYMTNLAINTPPPLAANAQRPDKEAAVQNYVNQFHWTNLVN